MAQRWNPPPSWPAPPPGWTPPAGWRPDPSWGPPPPGWSLWVDEGSWVARHRAATAGLAVVAVLVVGLGVLAATGVLGGDTAASPAAAGRSGEPAADPGSSAAGPAAPGGSRDGELEFAVESVECGLPTVGDGAVRAEGEFCVATVTATNAGSSTAILTGNDQRLLDEDGRDHEYDLTASVANDDAANALLELVEPGESLTAVLVFDVPAGTVAASMELHESSESAGVVVPVPR